MTQKNKGKGREGKKARQAQGVVPFYDVPATQFLVVEYPATVNDIGKAIRTFAEPTRPGDGGFNRLMPETLRKPSTTVDIYIPPRPVNLDPKKEYPQLHLEGKVRHPRGLIVDITRNADGTATPLIRGRVTETIEFPSLAKFVYPRVAGIGSRNPRQWRDGEWAVEQESDDDIKQAISAMAPTSLWKDDGVLGEKTNEYNFETHSKFDPKRLQAVSTRKVNSAGNPQHVEYHNWGKEMPKPTVVRDPNPDDPIDTELRRLFAERPIWSKKKLVSIVLSKLKTLKKAEKASEEGDGTSKGKTKAKAKGDTLEHEPSESVAKTKVRDALVPLAYYITGGPWTRTYVRYGYDPRVDRESRQYQVIAPTINRAAGKRVKHTDNSSAQVGDSENAAGVQIDAGTTIQVIDVMESVATGDTADRMRERVHQTVDDDHGGALDPRYGWFTKYQYEQLRVVMSPFRFTRKHGSDIVLDTRGDLKQGVEKASDALDGHARGTRSDSSPSDDVEMDDDDDDEEEEDDDDDTRGGTGPGNADLDMYEYADDEDDSDA